MLTHLYLFHGEGVWIFRKSAMVSRIANLVQTRISAVGYSFLVIDHLALNRFVTCDLKTCRAGRIHGEQQFDLDQGYWKRHGHSKRYSRSGKTEFLEFKLILPEFKENNSNSVCQTLSRWRPISVHRFSAPFSNQRLSTVGWKVFWENFQTCTAWILDYLPKG